MTKADHGPKAPGTTGVWKHKLALYLGPHCPFLRSGCHTSKLAA